MLYARPMRHGVTHMIGCGFGSRGSDTVNRRDLFAAGGLVGLSRLACWQPVGAMGWGSAFANPHGDDDGPRVTTTGHATAVHDRASGRNEAFVDNSITIHAGSTSSRSHVLPIDRLRARGEGRLHAAGD